MKKRLFLYLLFCIYGRYLFGQEKIELLIVPDNKVVTQGFMYHAKIYVLGKEFLEKTKDNLNIDTKIKGAKLERFANYYDLLIPTDSILSGWYREKEISYKLILNGQVFEASFKVKTPEIVASLGSMSFLYNQCGNIPCVQIVNWEYSNNYYLLCSTTNGKIKEVDDGNYDHFLIIPEITETTNKWECEVSIGAYILGHSYPIGKIFYKVYEPPKPVLQLFKQQKVQSCDKSVKRGEKVDLCIVANEEFKEKMPLDARYQMSDITVSIEPLDGKPISGKKYLMDFVTIETWKKTEVDSRIYFEATSAEMLNIPISEKLFATDAPKCQGKRIKKC